STPPSHSPAFPCAVVPREDWPRDRRTPTQDSTPTQRLQYRPPNPYSLFPIPYSLPLGLRRNQRPDPHRRTRRLRFFFIPSRQHPRRPVLHQPLHQRRMHCVPGAFRDHVAPDPAARQRQVADQVEYLVPHKLIPKPQWRILHLAFTDDDGALVGRSTDQAHIAQHRLVLAEAERPRRSDPVGIGTRLQIADKSLVPDRLGEINRVMDAVPAPRIDPDKLRPLAHFHFFEDLDVLALAALHLHPHAEDRVDIRLCAAVEDRHFEVVDL